MEQVGGAVGGVAAAGQVTPAVDVWKDDGHPGPRQRGTGSRAGGVVEKKMGRMERGQRGLVLKPFSHCAGAKWCDHFIKKHC